MNLEQIQAIIQRIQNDDPSSISNIQYVLGVLLGYLANLPPLPVSNEGRVYGYAPVGAMNGANKTFTLPPFVITSESVFLNGMRLRRGPDADYITASGGAATGQTVITLVIAPQAVDVLTVDYQPVIV